MSRILNRSVFVRPEFTKPTPSPRVEVLKRSAVVDQFEELRGKVLPPPAPINSGELKGLIEAARSFAVKAGLKESFGDDFGEALHSMLNDPAEYGRLVTLMVENPSLYAGVLEVLDAKDPKSAQKLRLAVAVRTLDAGKAKDAMEQLARSIAVRNGLKESFGDRFGEALFSMLTDPAEHSRFVELMAGNPELYGQVLEVLDEKDPERAQKLRRDVAIHQLANGGVKDALAGALAAREETAPEQEPLTAYTVVPGDTLFDIATRLQAEGVEGEVWDIIAHICELNGIENPDLIIAGSTLQLPTAGEGGE